MVAYAQLGMSEAEFNKSTTSYYMLRYWGYINSQRRQHVETMEQLRIHAYWCLAPYNTEQLTPAELLPLPWDKATTRTVDWDEINALMAADKRWPKVLDKKAVATA